MPCSLSDDRNLASFFDEWAGNHGCTRILRNAVQSKRNASRVLSDLLWPCWGLVVVNGFNPKFLQFLEVLRASGPEDSVRFSRRGAKKFGQANGKQSNWCRSGVYENYRRLCTWRTERKRAQEGGGNIEPNEERLTYVSNSWNLSLTLFTWAAVNEHKGKLAASSKVTSDGILIVMSCSRIAYSAKPPGRAFPEVAVGKNKLKIMEVTQNTYRPVITQLHDHQQPKTWLLPLTCRLFLRHHFRQRVPVRRLGGRHIKHRLD